jgi:hypothetical protein
MRAERPSPRRTEAIVMAGVAVAVAAALVQLAAQLVDYQVFDLRLLLLDSNKHRSLFGVASLLATACAIVAAFAGSLLRPRELAWDLLWFSLSILLLLRVYLGFHLLQAAPFVLVVFVLVWRLAAHASRGESVTLRVALCLLAVSFVVHVAAPSGESTFDYQRQSWEYQIRGMIKHGASLSGWILLASGLAAVGLRREPSRTASPGA